MLVPALQANAVGNQFDFIVSNIAYQSVIGDYGANVGYTVTATSNGSPVSSIVYNPASGSRFPVGDTAVICTATDSQSNSASHSFIITVGGDDSTPPNIIPPPDTAAASTGGQYTHINLGSPTVSDDTDPSPLVTNDAPAAGFQVGNTTVTWTATDHSGNSKTATQKVTISPPGNLTVSASPEGNLYKAVQS